MSIFASFLVLLLILVEAAPPTASSVPVLGEFSGWVRKQMVEWLMAGWVNE